MGSASTRATTNIEGVSAIIEANAAAAAQVGSTTAHVSDTLVAVRSTSQHQTDAAGNVTASLLALTAQVGDLQTTANHVADEAQTIGAIAARFRLGPDDAPQLAFARKRKSGDTSPALRVDGADPKEPVVF